MSYLARFLDPRDPSASLKHGAYALVVCCGCIWLSISVRRLDANWVAAFAALLAAVTTGKIAGPQVGVAAPTGSGSGSASGGCIGSPSTGGPDNTDGAAQC